MITTVLAAAAMGQWQLPLKTTLNTPHYEVTLLDYCNEDFDCDKIVAKIRTNTTTVTLNGKHTWKMCRDGVTPCHPIGYFFKDRVSRYVIYEDGELQISKGTKLLVSEKGEMKEHWTLDSQKR